MTPLVDRPGAVNAHTHLYSALVPLGIPWPAPPPTTFPEILRRLWWRLDRALDADTLRAAARYYVANALLAGTTTLIDHHESPAFIEGSLDVIAAACDDLGVRAVLCYGATERNGGRAEAQRGLAESKRFALARRAGLVRGVIGLHACFTVSDDTLREAGKLARELGVPLHLHLAEDLVDVTDARARGFDSPLARLLSLGAAPAGSILAHGVHLTPLDVATCREQHLWLVNNPRSNEANRVGYARSLGRAACVALGTDGFPAEMSVEVAALEALAARHADGKADPPARLAAGRLLAGEIFGAGALALDRVRAAAPEPQPPARDRAGDLSGDRAGDLSGDLSCAPTDDLQPPRPHPRPAASASADPPRVVEVEIAGRLVVRDGALVAGSLESITRDARRAATQLRDTMEKIP